MAHDIKYAIEFPEKHIQIGRRRLENIPGACIRSYSMRDRVPYPH